MTSDGPLDAPPSLPPPPSGSLPPPPLSSLPPPPGVMALPPPPEEYGSIDALLQSVDPATPAHLVFQRLVASVDAGREALEAYGHGDRVRPSGTWSEHEAGVLDRVGDIQRKNPGRQPSVDVAEACLRAPGSEDLLGFDGHEAALDLYLEAHGQHSQRRAAARRIRSAADQIKKRGGRPLSWGAGGWRAIVWLATLPARALLAVLLLPGLALREACGALVVGRPLNRSVRGGLVGVERNERTPVATPSVRRYRWFVLLPMLVLAVLALLLLLAMRWRFLSSGVPILLMTQQDQETFASSTAPSEEAGIAFTLLNLRLPGIGIWLAFSMASAMIPSTKHIERLLDDANLRDERWLRVLFQPIRLIRWLARPVDWLLDKALGSLFVGSGLLLLGGLMVVAEVILRLILGPME